MASRELVLSEAFLQDLDDVTRYISRFDSVAARTFYRAALDVTDVLAEGRADGPALQGAEAAGDVRKLGIGRYRNYYVVYRRLPGRVEVLRLADARRDPAAILREALA